MRHQLIQIFKVAFKDALWVLSSLIKSLLKKVTLKPFKSDSLFFKFRFIFGLMILSFLSLIAGSTSTMNLIPSAEFNNGGHGDPVIEIHQLLARLQSFENSLFSQKNLEIQSKIQNISLNSNKKLQSQLEFFEEQSRNQKAELNQIFLKNLPTEKIKSLGISPEEISLEIDHLFSPLEKQSKRDLPSVSLNFKSIFRQTPLIVAQFQKICIYTSCLVKFQNLTKESYNEKSSIRQDLTYYLNHLTIRNLRHDLNEQSTRPIFQLSEKMAFSLFREIFFETYLEFSKERSFFATLSIEAFSRIQKLREQSDMRRSARELERCLDTILENFYSFGFDWEQDFLQKGPHLSFQGFLFGPSPQFARQTLDRFHSEPHLLTSLQIESAL